MCRLSTQESCVDYSLIVRKGCMNAWLHVFLDALHCMCMCCAQGLCVLCVFLCLSVCLSVPQSIWLQCTNANGASIRMSMGKALPSGCSRVYLLQPETSPKWMNSGPSETLWRLPWTTHACVFSLWTYVFLELRAKECPLQWVCMWETWQEMMTSPIHVSHVNNLCLSRLLCISCKSSIPFFLVQKSSIPFFLVHSALHVVDIEGDDDLTDACLASQQRKSF